MKIATTYYSLKHKAFEIYVAGCKGNCKGCCNPELKYFTIGEDFNIDKIKHKLQDSLVEQIWILGGDPIDQDKRELIQMLEELKKYNKPIWIWTRYEFYNVDSEVIEYLDYIKCGEYISELTTNENIQYGIKLATNNQKIYKLKGDN